MLGKIIYISLLFLIFSCKQKEIDFYENGKTFRTYELKNNKYDGEYIEYYPNGNIQEKHSFKEGVLIDSSIYFNSNKQKLEIDYYLKNKSKYCKLFTNNILTSEGNFYLNQKRGKWKYYYANGKLKMQVEYINLCGKQYTNQVWKYNVKGTLDTLKSQGYYKLKMKKGIFKVNEIICMNIIYKPILYKNSTSIICFGTNTDKAFCNINKIGLDTIISNNHEFKLKFKSETKGTICFRGYIKEFYYKKVDVTDSTSYGERFTYFDIPIKIE